MKPISDRIYVWSQILVTSYLIAWSQFKSQIILHILTSNPLVTTKKNPIKQTTFFPAPTHSQSTSINSPQYQPNPIHRIIIDYNPSPFPSSQVTHNTCKPIEASTAGLALLLRPSRASKQHFLLRVRRNSSPACLRDVSLASCLWTSVPSTSSSWFTTTAGPLQQPTAKDIKTVPLVSYESYQSRTIEALHQRQPAPFSLSLHATARTINGGFLFFYVCGRRFPNNQGPAAAKQHFSFTFNKPEQKLKEIITTKGSRE